MTISERLRAHTESSDMYGTQREVNVCVEAADIIDELAAALEPFAAYSTANGFGLDSRERPVPDDTGVGWVYLTVGDFRRAHASRARVRKEAGQ